MFTIEQINKAHSSGTSGADFPRYVQDIIKLGVTGFEVFVNDGHSLYFGNEGFKIQSGESYPPLEVMDYTDKDQFFLDLRATQQGKTDFLTFCSDCAKSGVARWIVNLSKMTCTYYNKAGNEILVETIPVPR